MSSSIASSIIAALKSFNEFVEQTKAPQAQNVQGLSTRGWEDELGRLRVWAANIGAHQTNQSSLDFRLRDASHIREQILKLLERLTRRLEDAREVLEEGMEDDPDVTSDDEDGEYSLGMRPEMEQMQESVGTIINCLFQMSMLVRKPAQHDLRVGSTRSDVAVFEPFDYGHVRNKFPDADQSLVARLGSAITRRRMYLKYRERHAAKLKQGMTKVANTGEVVDGDTATLLSDTVATSAQNWNIDFDERTSDSGASETSYAATLTNGAIVTIPPPPKGSQGGMPFECPICFHIIKVESTHSWNRHVFLDLEPYVCLDLSCTTPQRLYATRHEWLQHLKTIHSSIRDTKTTDTDEVACALCAMKFRDQVGLIKHSARHLQDLALFVLPPNLHDVEDESHSERSSLNGELEVDSPNQRSSTEEEDDDLMNTSEEDKSLSDRGDDVDSIVTNDDEETHNDEEETRQEADRYDDIEFSGEDEQIQEKSDNIDMLGSHGQPVESPVRNTDILSSLGQILEDSVRAEYSEAAEREINRSHQALRANREQKYQ